MAPSLWLGPRWLQAILSHHFCVSRPSGMEEAPARLLPLGSSHQPQVLRPSRPLNFVGCRQLQCGDWTGEATCRWLQCRLRCSLAGQRRPRRYCILTHLLRRFLLWGRVMRAWLRRGGAAAARRVARASAVRFHRISTQRRGVVAQPTSRRVCFQRRRKGGGRQRRSSEGRRWRRRWRLICSTRRQSGGRDCAWQFLEEKQDYRGSTRSPGSGRGSPDAQ